MKKIILSESQFKKLFETNKIRRVKDNEYPKKQYNPKNDKVFSKLKDDDKNFKEKFGFERDSIEPFKGHFNQKKNIDNLQKDLTNKIQNRLKAKGDSIYVDPSTIDISNKALERLSDNGIEIGISGETFSHGNSKLPPTTMIINLTSAFNCPSLNCPLRQNVCYAGKMEKRYINPELRNLRNEFALEQLTVKEILQLLDAYIMNANVRVKRIRLSESGDFKSQEVVDFCDKLAGHLEAKYGIKTTCYTHQRFDFTNCKNMIVNSSLPREMIKGADRNYLAVNKKVFDEIGDGLRYDEKRNEVTFKCHCDCYKCNFCYNTKEENGEDPNLRTNVYVAFH